MDYIKIYTHSKCGLSNVFRHKLRKEVVQYSKFIEFIDIECEPFEAYQDEVKAVPFTIITRDVGDEIEEQRLIGYSDSLVEIIKRMLETGNFDYKGNLH